MQVQIALPIEEIIAFCERHPIRKPSLFGSVLRDDFDNESDVDMLVEFEPDAKIGLFEITRQELELTRLIGRKVDLRTPAELSRYFRQSVVDTAMSIYERQ